MKNPTFLLLAFLACLPLVVAAADKKPGSAASIRSVEFRTESRPGPVPMKSITAIVRVELDADYHVHSHQPSETLFVPTELSLEPPRGIQVGKPVFPKGKSVKVAGLYKPLSVYQGFFDIQVPLIIGEGTALPAVIPAVLSYQACQGPTCFPPIKLKFEIKIPAPPRE